MIRQIAIFVLFTLISSSLAFAVGRKRRRLLRSVDERVQNGSLFSDKLSPVFERKDFSALLKGGIWNAKQKDLNALRTILDSPTLTKLTETPMLRVMTAVIEGGGKKAVFEWKKVGFERFVPTFIALGGKVEGSVRIYEAKKSDAKKPEMSASERVERITKAAKRKRRFEYAGAGLAALALEGFGWAVMKNVAP